jgi:hypothetical protein
VTEKERVSVWMTTMCVCNREWVCMYQNVREREREREREKERGSSAVSSHFLLLFLNVDNSKKNKQKIAIVFKKPT